MPLFSPIEVMNLKLSCIPLIHLKMLARNLGMDDTGSAAEIIKRIFGKGVKEEVVDGFIKQRYIEKIQERRATISDEDLKQELKKVRTFTWGVVQGQTIRPENTNRICPKNRAL